MNWIYKGREFDLSEHQNSYGFVYRIICKVNSKIYIGCKFFNKTWKPYYGSSKKLKNDIKLYGKENFVREILELCRTREETISMEMQMHKQLNVSTAKTPNGEQLFYNKIISTGYIPDSTGKTSPNFGKKASPETRLKISAANKGDKNAMFGKKPPNFGKAPSVETRLKLSVALKGDKNPMFGKTHSAETRLKMSAALKGDKNPNFGKTRSAETRLKISAAKKGDKNPNFGKTRSAETRLKISAANKGKSQSAETRLKRSAGSKGEKIQILKKTLCRDKTENF